MSLVTNVRQVIDGDNEGIS